MLQTMQPVKIKGDDADAGRAGYVVRDTGEEVEVKLDGDTETKTFKAEAVEAL